MSRGLRGGSLVCWLSDNNSVDRDHIARRALGDKLGPERHRLRTGRVPLAQGMQESSAVLAQCCQQLSMEARTAAWPRGCCEHRDRGHRLRYPRPLREGLLHEQSDQGTRHEAVRAFRGACRDDAPASARHQRRDAVRAAARRHLAAAARRRGRTKVSKQCGTSVQMLRLRYQFALDAFEELGPIDADAERLAAYELVWGTRARRALRVVS